MKPWRLDYDPAITQVQPGDLHAVDEGFYWDGGIDRGGGGVGGDAMIGQQPSNLELDLESNFGGVDLGE